MNISRWYILGDVGADGTIYLRPDAESVFIYVGADKARFISIAKDDLALVTSSLELVAGGYPRQDIRGVDDYVISCVGLKVGIYSPTHMNSPVVVPMADVMSLVDILRLISTEYTTHPL